MSIDWNKRTETLDAVAEDALDGNGMLVKMVRIGTGLERESIEHNDDDYREAAYRSAVAVSNAYTDEIARIANGVWVSRKDELNALAIGEGDVYDAMCEAFYNAAMGISYA